MLPACFHPHRKPWLPWRTYRPDRKPPIPLQHHDHLWSWSTSMWKHSKQNVRRSKLQLFNCVFQFYVCILHNVSNWSNKANFCKKKSILQRCIEFACTVGTFPYPWHVASIDSMYLKSQIWELHVLLAFVGICLFTSQILRSKVFNSFNFVLLELTCQNGIYSKTELWHFTALLGRNYQEKSDPICEYKKSEWAFYFFLIRDLYSSNVKLQISSLNVTEFCYLEYISDISKKTKS